MEAILEIENLSVIYRRTDKKIRAVEDFSFKLYENETVCIAGESGSGKSTVAYAILKLIDSSEGEIVNGKILYKGTDILKLNNRDMSKIRGGQIGIIFQDPFSSLNPVLTCGEQIRETLITHLKYEKLSYKNIEDKIDEILTQVQLYDKERIKLSYPHQLSGGQRQRICIACAICTKPKILIADEPTTALDVTTAREIISLIEKLQKEMKMSVVFISHNLQMAFKISDRILIMYAGQLIEEGYSEMILKEPSHPYTRMLVNVLPKIEKKGQKLPSIPGQVPDMISIPEGCRFNPRCPDVMDICRRIEPELIRVDGRNVRCHKYKL